VEAIAFGITLSRDSASAAAKQIASFPLFAAVLKLALVPNYANGRDRLLLSSLM
jgi:hypothetical protein